MDEIRTAAILVELQRLGVDLGLVSGPLVGTGLRASELLEWLRTIPDGVGADEVLSRLDVRARAAASRAVAVRWRPEPARPTHRYERERWWPTQSLLDAGTDLMIEEWDPFGVRLAGTDREQIAMFVFHFFAPLLVPNGRRDPVSQVAELIAAAERDDLALRPSPESHRRYLAQRLAELVERYPVPDVRREPVAASSRSARSVVALGPPRHGAPPALDPEGVCARCHGFGVIARITTIEEPGGWTRRYCAACWPVVRSETTFPERTPETAAEHIAFLDFFDRPPSPPTETESRSWDDVRDHIALLTRRRDDDSPAIAPSDSHAAEVARHLREREDVMDGPMPADVAAFVDKHTPHA